MTSPGASTSPTIRSPGGGAVDQAGREMGRDQRAGHQRPAQLLEDEHGLGHARARRRRRPRAAGARTPRCRPARASGRGPRRRRLEARGRPPSGTAPRHRSRMPSCRARSSSSARSPLRAPSAGRGPARRRCCAGSACVPAAIEMDMAWSHPRTCSPLRSPRCRRSDRPARPSMRMARSPSCWRTSRVGQLEHRAAEARARRSRCGLADVASGQRPQRVELGGQVADLAAQLGVVPRGARRLGSPLGHVGQVADERVGLEQLADERRAPLEAERDHGHPPAVVLVAHPVARPGTRTSSRKTSLNSVAADDRLAADGSRCPACPSAGSATRCPCASGASGSVRTSSSQ